MKLLAHTRIKGDDFMSDKKLPKEFKYNNEEAKKDEGNNQWTNNNLKYYPDTRERRDGPGGEDAGTK